MKIFFNLQVSLFLLLCPLMSFGFDLSISHTNETCAGNGSLTFTVSNTNPGGSIVYLVYKLPDVTTPYASGPDPILNGLTAGTYRIIARETVGSTTTTQQQDVTITSSFTPLTYTVNSTNQACSNMSTVSVTVDTGAAVSYAIISGPSTFPPQTSNTFTGLAAGIYRIRVTDSCGNSLVQAFTVSVNPPLLGTNNPRFTDTSPPSCNFIVANNTIVAAQGTVIAYPVQVLYTLYLPGGVTNSTTVLNSGDPASQNISLTIPYDINNDYIYSITLTDVCGITYPANNFIVNNSIKLASDVIPLPCNEYYFIINVLNFSGSYTLQFTNSPAGFNATAFNSSYPGPLSQPSVIFGGSTNPTPIGDYEITVTDICGKTDTLSFKVEDKPPVVTAIGGSFGCLSNQGQITVSGSSSKLVTAIITTAPAGYPSPVPHNVTAVIDNLGVLNLSPVPQGDYVFRVTDDCGNVYDPVEVTVPPYDNQGLNINVLPGCGIGRASLNMTSNNSKLVSVKITAAPSSYAFPIPHDVSNNILANGEMYLADLPSGSYTFTVLDGCNFTNIETRQINGYTITRNSFSLVADCGVFNIPLDVLNNITVNQTFGLQKLLNPVTNTWGNPVSGAVYTDGTVPNATNSYMLQNNQTNLNITFNGTFRIVHYFTSYNSGGDIKGNVVNSPIKDCIEVLSPTLSFNNALTINNVYLIPCSSSGNFDVFISANGAPPLRYRIIEKDNSPFVVDNGNSDVFLNLGPGIYKFEVEDSCGNSVNRTFDVTDLTSLVTVFPVCNILKCVPTITGNETFDLSAQSAAILGIQSATDYTLSYHPSQADADANTNTITNLTGYNPVSNPQTIYTRLFFNQLPNCYQTGTFDLVAGQTPKVNLAPDYVSCGGQPVNLDASGGNLPSTSYTWSTGATTSGITVSDVGTSSIDITASNTYGSCNGTDLSCTTSKTIVVNIAAVPVIDHIDLHDWTDNQNSITVVTAQSGNWEYSIDGINFQNSPLFSNLLPGLYTVYVRDPGSCTTLTQEIWLLNYPKFFTPNGDGYNETWYVRNSDNEPDFKVYIYDRYGKLITNILSNGPGWDGKYNGKVLFADDYWFTAYRQDGRIHRGHFTLKR